MKYTQTIDGHAASALMNITQRPEQVFVRGGGSWLWDQHNRRYLDFVQGWAVNCLGHCPEVITEAIAAQAGRLLSASPAYFNAPSIELANLIVSWSDFDQVFFTNSGAEANEGAIKLTRRWAANKRGPDCYEIITFRDAFHGRTLAAMSASGKPQFELLFEPKVPGFPKAILNDLESVERLISARTAAVMLEPIQGEAGVVEATDNFLRDLRALTERHGLLLIVDEIQTGVARTGLLWGYQHATVKPDIMTLGKGLGGGVPLGALVATDAVSCFEPGDQGGTFNGNALMTAVGCAVMKQVTAPAFLAQVSEQSNHLRQSLQDLSARYSFGDVRGRGLLMALDLLQPIANQVVALALQGGLLVNAPRDHLLRFMPALTVSRAEIDAMVEVLDQCIGRTVGK